MKKMLNNVLGFIPFNGNKLNLGLVLGALQHMAPQLLAFVPAGYVDVVSTVFVLVGAIHKMLKK